jgi:hypothetical protein
LQYRNHLNWWRTEMKPLIVAAAFAAAFLAGCDRSEDSASSKQAPTTASGGASGAAPSPAPTGEKMTLPEAPKASGSGENKPDPGDANDHSTPAHDAKQKSGG